MPFNPKDGMTNLDRLSTVRGYWIGTWGNEVQIINSSGAFVGPGTADVVGPASSTDNALARFHLTTGKIIQNSNAILDDTGNLSLAGTATTTKLLAGDGISSAVGIGFSSDPDTGFIRNGSGDFLAVANSTTIVRFNTTSVDFSESIGLTANNSYDLGSSANRFKDFYSAGTANLGTALISNSATAASFIPSGSSIPANGIYLPSANTLGFATNSLDHGSISSTGAWSLGSSASTVTHLVNGLELRVSASSASQSTVRSQNTGAGDAVLAANVSGAGDPHIHFNGTGLATLWHAGVDNSDSDRFVIGTGTVPGTGTAFSIDSAGTTTSGISGSTTRQIVNGGFDILATASDYYSVYLHGATTNPNTINYSILNLPEINTNQTLAAYGTFTRVASPNSSFTTPVIANFVADGMLKGSSHTVTNFINYLVSNPAQWTGTNNAMFGDSTTFSGNYFLVQENSTYDSKLAGQLTAKSFIPTDSAVPTNGIFLPSANTVGFSANSAQTASLSSSGLSLIGRMALAGASLSTSALVNNSPSAAQNPLSGVTQRAYRTSMVGTSAATTDVVAFSSAVSTEAASFTAARRVHFEAVDQVKGSGSTITRDIAFRGAPTQGTTGNALLADNDAFSGNWVINSTNTNPSRISGYFEVANQADPGAVTDGIRIGSVDISAGNASLSLRTETAVVSESVTSDRTLQVQINGTTYKICLKA